MTIQQAIDLISAELPPETWISVEASKAGFIPRLSVKYTIAVTIGDILKSPTKIFRHGPNLESLAILVAGLAREEISALKAPKDITPIDGVEVGMETATA